MDSPPQRDTLTPHRRIYELDGLRALAAISLVLFHFTHVFSNKYGYSSPLGFEWPYGAYGTELFFILSGYVNSMSLLRRRRPVDFAAARLIRILPLFLIVIVANLWILALPPMGQTVSTSELAANLTLLPRVLGYECFDPVMWTLQIEMIFYGLLLVLYCTGGLERYFVGWGTVLCLSLCVCPTLDLLEASQSSYAWFGLATAARRLLLLDFAPLFAIGFMLYRIRSGHGSGWRNSLAVLICAIVFHAIDHGKHNPVATLLIVALIAAAAYGKVPPLRSRPLIFVSTISYALYLCHNNLGCAMIYRFDRFGLPPVTCFAIACMFSVSLAILLTRYVEGPITSRLRKEWERVRIRRTAETELATEPA